ncbi:Small nuclear ribonucleoprotein E [Seminavis robusta]|uniref:Small nuclear ribonucleoprotein E n=1 Tax=Seminavis robusta TaxID=568900 RepID=A0A9N8DPH5_9STRA|nr:Small nuclear ribonucleoprotein E [Seminavis robusta]CAB9504366.1 Small nuclear ribonucleoprotein E [Seminavis robusta]|eukprot:Sro194_g083010.1 Small nuclear ribonucleoprotein E (98) ;mRNA; r:79688-80128
MPPKRVKKVMTLPINVIFSHLQKKTRVRVGLYEDTRLQIEGQIIGFDEYMNMVLDDAVEIDSKKNKRVEVGRILLKGDSITMLQEAQPVRPMPAGGD